VSTGFPATIRLLSETKNEAAVPALVAGLDSPRQEIREACLAAVLSRRSPAAHREVLRRLHALDERGQGLVRLQQGRMTRALRDAILDDDPQLCANGCMAAVWFPEYDLIPTLITALEDQSNPNAPIAGKTLIELAEQLYAELAAPRSNDRHRSPQIIRHRVVGDLELSAARYGSHRRRQIIEALALLVKRDNATMRRVLLDPRHSAFTVLIDVLAHSTAGGVMRLLLTFLDDPHAPMAVLNCAANRSDLKFVRHFLRKIGREPSAAVKQNLKRIRSVGWIRDGLGLLDELDDLEQHAVVELVMHSGMPRGDAFFAVEHLLVNGQPAGRRAAAEALATFQGAEANRLTLTALEDSDHQVQASAVRQLRQRGIPGILPRLVEMVESPHSAVRHAVRESLVEFSFPRFLAAFDMLDDEVRKSTGMLVKKLDPQTIPLLKAEMESQVRTRRLRAVAMARAADAVDQLEEAIAALLKDEDYLVRVKAALALGECDSLGSLDALQAAEQDTSVSVREAARTSLHRRRKAADWQNLDYET
jgi:HEAT repeat protein